jgi:hypothetical protein
MRSFFVVLGLLMALTGCGITAPHDNVGYADLGGMGFRDVNHRTTVSIGPALLRFAARHVDDDPDTRAILRGLEGVQVRIFEIDGDADRVAQKLKRISTHLQASEWLPVAVIQEQGEQVHVLVRTQDDTIMGLAVLTADHDEAVLVNVIGELSPRVFGSSEFGKAMASLDVDMSEFSLLAQ